MLTPSWLQYHWAAICRATFWLPVLHVNLTCSRLYISIWWFLFTLSFYKHKNTRDYHFLLFDVSIVVCFTFIHLFHVSFMRNPSRHISNLCCHVYFWAHMHRLPSPLKVIIVSIAVSLGLICDSKGAGWWWKKTQHSATTRNVDSSFLSKVHYLVNFLYHCPVTRSSALSQNFLHIAVLWSPKSQRIFIMLFGFDDSATGWLLQTVSFFIWKR